jgi:hypothetical protein
MFYNILFLFCFCIFFYFVICTFFVLSEVSPFVLPHPIFVQVYPPLPPSGNPIAVNKYHITMRSEFLNQIQPKSVNKFVK